MKTRITKAIELLISDRPLLFLATGIGLLALSFVLYVAFSLSPTELQVATRFTSFGETRLYRNKWYYLISFIVVAIVIAVAHVGLMIKLKARNIRSMALAFGWLTVGLLVILFVVTQRVLSSAFLS